MSQGGPTAGTPAVQNGCNKVFIQRDYSEGTAVKFHTRLPSELEGLTSRQPEDELNEVGCKGTQNDLSPFMSGKNPSELMNHVKCLDLYLDGITIKELCNTYACPSFNFKELEEQFAIVCHDYTKDITTDSKSYAVEFSTIVLFTIGPHFRSLRNTSTHKEWRINTVNDKQEKYTIYVSTFNNYSPLTSVPKVKNKVLCLTVRQASLIAVSIYSKVVNAIHKAGSDINLTPLARLIFSKEDIKYIVEDIRNLGQDASETSIFVAIVESCEKGGEWLVHSQACIAITAAICATQQITDKKLRHDIIGRTYKEYQNAGKKFDHDLFLIYARYAHCDEIPTEYLSEICKFEFGDAYKFSRFDRRSALSTTMKQMDAEDKPTTSNKASLN